MDWLLGKGQVADPYRTIVSKKMKTHIIIKHKNIIRFIFLSKKNETHIIYKKIFNKCTRKSAKKVTNASYAECAPTYIRRFVSLAGLGLHPMTCEKGVIAMPRKRDIPIKIYMNTTEYEELRKIKNETGQSMRAVITKAIMGMPLIPAEVITKVHNINLKMSEQYRQLRGMATNINQLARVANKYQCPADILELEHIKEELHLMREELDDTWRLLRSLLQNLGPVKKH